MDFMLTASNLKLKPITEDDMDALCQVYRSTREKELATVWGWTDEEKQAFVLQQFLAQHTYYQNNYIGADFWILEKNGQCIGRLYVDWNFGSSSIRIIDIIVLPAWQNQGIGTQILNDLIGEAKRKQFPLTIHVESFNPAKRLYERLGFKMISETNGVYHLMEWKNTI